MVKEVVPPKASRQPGAAEAAFQSPQPKRAPSPDSDDDITRLVGSFSSQTPSRNPFVQAKPSHDPFSGPQTAGSLNRGGFTQHPTFGRPSKMMSSLKQKAGVLIKQKSHPEHHRGATEVSTPRPQKYADRKPPPMPVFDSNSNDPYRPQPRSTADPLSTDEVFYTDPNKANEDLKALLEGGMDSDEEEEPKTNDQNTDGNNLKDQAPKLAGKGTVVKDGAVDGLKVQLLPHQVEGVEWMRGRELGPVKRGKVPKGGILADDMGLGKTLQTVSLILTQQRPAKDDKGWKKQFENVHKGTLVVAPLALIRQWESEINEKVSKTHGLKVLVHHGPSRTKDFKGLMKYDVVITTFQILVSEHGHTNDKVQTGCFGIHWWRVVLDEAHTIKNRNAKMTKACYALRSEYRWCLTGTPMQNNLEELQSLIRFLQIAPYSDLKHWKEHIDRPFKEGKGHIAIKRLHSLLRCFMKRRTKAILKEDGALNPGGKPTAEGEKSKTGFKVTERKVLTIAAALGPAERRFYDNLENRANENMQNIMKEGGQKYTHAFTLLLRLRQACNHPRLVIGKLDKDAMSTGGGNAQADSQNPSQQDTAVDGLADLLGGMTIEKKRCSVCGKAVDAAMGSSEMCAECSADLEAFNTETPKRKKSRRRSQVRKVEKQKLKSRQRRPRNRNAVLDSDDEEEQGSWLVPEGERGSLKLGKAGGSEDENAEGGGEMIGSDDSDEEGRSQDHRDLSSFVVDDEKLGRDGEPEVVELDSETDSDSSLESISALTSKMASQTLQDKKKPAAKSARKPASFSTSTRSSAFASDDGSSTESDGVDASSIYASDSDDNAFTSAGDPTRVLASAKVSEMLRLLHAEAHEHKFIVFSQFTTMLDLVGPFLRREGFRFARYDGSMKNDDREESLRRLRKEDSCRILLCSLKCGSLGLNLTAATRVIIVEPFWNPFVEEQAIDRVHRLTQTVDVIVYKLTVSATVEERILELQEKKRLLAEQTIEGAGGKGKKDALKLGLNDIMNLFRPQSVTQEGDELEIASAMAGLMKRRPESGRPPQVQRQGSGAYDRRW